MVPFIHNIPSVICIRFFLFDVQLDGMLMMLQCVQLNFSVRRDSIPVGTVPRKERWGEVQSCIGQQSKNGSSNYSLSGAHTDKTGSIYYFGRAPYPLQKNDMLSLPPPEFNCMHHDVINALTSWGLNQKKHLHTIFFSMCGPNWIQFCSH